MLMPTMADTNNDVMNNSTIMPQMMNNNSTAPAANDSAASQAMRYSMARDVAWLLSGDCVLDALVLAQHLRDRRHVRSIQFERQQ